MNIDSMIAEHKELDARLTELGRRIEAAVPSWTGLVRQGFNVYAIRKYRALYSTDLKPAYDAIRVYESALDNRRFVPVVVLYADRMYPETVSTPQCVRHVDFKVVAR